ncbi:uncharacterized protein Dana_GF27209 [Drosophila ananassae]|nr:uncharacterized protein Dana_GF27209 [Drosophila ananassae]
MKRLVKKYKRSASQIVLRYLVDYGVIPIPKAANPLHIKENLNIFDFKLEEADSRALRGIKPKKRIVKYEMVKDHPFYPFERDVDEDDQPDIKSIVEPEITNPQPEDEEEKEEDTNMNDE